MSTENVDRQQQKAREFLSLLPLTLELAGLPRAEAGKILTEGQLESRATSIRAAYKIARQLIVELAK
jgi:hypothetical protein